MKKRKYVKPAIDAIRIEMESFIAVSADLDNTLQPGDSGTFTPTDPDRPRRRGLPHAGQRQAQHVGRLVGSGRRMTRKPTNNPKKKRQ